jgi:hypothetical protein
MQYGNHLYPNFWIETSDGASRAHWDASELYYEYLKCFDYTNQTSKPMISKEEFETVFPFACIKPFNASGQFQPTPPSDLIIRFQGGHEASATTKTQGGGKYAIITYTLETLKVNADSSITPFKI